MGDIKINQTIVAIIFILFIISIKYIEVGFRILLIKLKVIRKGDDRSCAQIIGYRIGKLFGKISTRI